MKKNDIVVLRGHYGLILKGTSMLVLQTRGTKLQVQLIENGQCMTRIIPTTYFRDSNPEERVGYITALNQSNLLQAISLAFHNEVATLFAMHLKKNHQSELVREVIPLLVDGVFTKDILFEDVNTFLNLFNEKGENNG